jgi:hypothetical protein
MVLPVALFASEAYTKLLIKDFNVKTPFIPHKRQREKRE